MYDTQKIYEELSEVMDERAALNIARVLGRFVEDFRNQIERGDLIAPGGDLNKRAVQGESPIQEENS